jgi:hypothetical protein
VERRQVVLTSFEERHASRATLLSGVDHRREQNQSVGVWRMPRANTAKQNLQHALDQPEALRNAVPALRLMPKETSRRARGMSNTLRDIGSCQVQIPSPALLASTKCH